MSKAILFEGRILKKDSVGRIWRTGGSLFCFYENKSLLLGQFEDEVWAEFVLKEFLLSQLGR